MWSIWHRILVEGMWERPKVPNLKLPLLISCPLFQTEKNPTPKGSNHENFTQLGLQVICRKWVSQPSYFVNSSLLADSLIEVWAHLSLVGPAQRGKSRSHHHELFPPFSLVRQPWLVHGQYPLWWELNQMFCYWKIRVTSCMYLKPITMV